MAAGTGINGGFYFDPNVFADYMAEQPYLKTAIIASGIVRDDAVIAEAIGSQGNIGTIPFYKPIDIDTYAPVNNTGAANNTPQETAGGKQSFMAVQRMKAFKDKDFTREISGANPLQNVASQISNYYQQVWQKVLMSTLKGVMGISSMATHKTNISVTSGSIADTNKVSEYSDIELCQKACGDLADRFTLAIMHSAVYARLQKLQLINYTKYTIPGGLKDGIELPTWNGKIVIVDDKYTVDTTTSGFPVYSTYFVGAGSFLAAPKALITPYYTKYDPETDAGTNVLYTKQSKVLHPNGFSIKFNNIAAESPTDVELGTAANWELAFNEKNITIAELKTNG